MKQSLLFLLTVCGIILSGTNELAAQKKIAEEDTTFVLSDVHIISKKINKSSILPIPVPVKFVPLNTLKVNADFLEAREITDIVNATRFMPSVKTQTLYGGFQVVHIRGFSHQLMTIDGVPDQRSFITSMPIHDLSNIESMELLRGPASVLFGQSVVGGVLNVTRKQPTRDTHVKAKVGVGSFNEKNAYFGMSGKLVGPLTYYASVNYSNSDGWRDNGVERFSAYFTTEAQLTEKDNLQLTYNFSKDKYDTDAGLPKLMANDIYDLSGKLYLNKFESLPGLDRSARYNNESDFLKNRSQDITLRYEHIFNDNIKLRDVASFRYDNIDYFCTEGLSYLESNDPIYNHYYMKNDKKVYINLDTVTNSGPLRFNHVTYGYSNQLDLLGKFEIGSIKNNYNIGYSYNYLHRPSYGWTRDKDIYGPGYKSLIPVHNPYSGGFIGANLSKVSISDRKSHGIYLSDIADILDNFKVMLSGRYDIYRYRSVSSIPLIEGTMDWESVPDDKYSSIRNNAFSYRVGAVYLPIPDLSLYASVGSFFKPNNTIYTDNTVYLNKNGDRYNPKDGGEVFVPEDGYQVEAGFKYDFKGFAANASYFYIRKNNIVTSLGTIEEDNATKTVKGQVGKMSSQGFEVDLSYTFRTLLLKAGYSYTDAHIGKIASNDYLETNSDRGNQYTYVPKNQFFFTADYTFIKGFLKGLGGSFSLNYQDKVYANITDNLTFDSYWMTDLSLHYKLLNNITILGTINNLFDAHYTASALGTQFMPGAERNYRLSLTYSF